MTELLTADQMREVEQGAIAAGAVTGLGLMEAAGQGVVAAIFEAWPALSHSSYRAAVLCGPGNNGGDGFVIARLLRELGWEVTTYFLGDAARLGADARCNYDRWCGVGRNRPLVDADIAEVLCGAAGVDVVVDALFGTGLTRRLEGLEITQKTLNRCVSGGKDGPKVVAVDIPSGLNTDTGVFAGSVVGAPLKTCCLAHLTVSFHRAKLGHYLASGPAACGRLVVKDIGLGARAPSGDATEVARLAVPRLDLLQKENAEHKYAHGHALVLSGGVGQGGAARLAARGALRIGAGLVSLGCPPAAVLENACQLNAVMLKRVRGAQGVAEVLKDARINAVCVGPGQGSRAETCDLVAAVLLARRSTVVDADGVSAFASDPAALFEKLHAGCVVTPHGGEFARLFPDISQRLQAADISKVAAVREAAARAGCVVLLKGMDTVIAAPDGRASVHTAGFERAAPWLATAGSGDVLAGFVTGLLARGFAPFEAAETSAWLHVEAARRFGAGLIAEDLPEVLPEVLARVLGPLDG